MKYLQYILLFLIVSCSDTKKNSSTSEVDISLKSFNSDLTVGSTTYTGPEKINYLLGYKPQVKKKGLLYTIAFLAFLFFLFFICFSVF